MGIPCCGYTIRSYDHAGNTIWRRNYWYGAKNTDPSRTDLGVAVDSSGNVYHCGPCAIACSGDSTWSLISYNPSGDIRWKKDIRAIGRALGYSGFDGSMWSVCCTTDDKIVCVGIHITENEDGTNRNSIWIFDVNGNSTTLSGSIIDQDAPPSIFYKKSVVAWGTSVVLVNPWSSYLTSTMAARSPTKMLFDFGQNGTGIYGARNPWQIATLGEVGEIFPTMYDQGPNKFNWAYCGGIVSDFYVTSYITAIACSDDGSKVYVSGVNLNAILGGTGIKGTVFKLVPDIHTHAYYNNEQGDDGKGNPYSPGECLNELGTYTPGVDTAYWGVNGPVRSSAAVISTGIAMGGGGLPHIEVYSDTDGTSVWAHNHHNVVAMAKTSDRLYTVGGFQNSAGESSFVSVTTTRTNCDGICYGTCNYKAILGTRSEIEYETSGTWTASRAGLLTITAQGGGGAGGSGDAGYANGGNGGGGGGTAIKTLSIGTGYSVSITINSNGTPGSSGSADTSGGDGGSVTVTGSGLSLSAGGGSGGYGQGGTAKSGNGGTASGGDSNFTGGNGSTSSTTTGGHGGESQDGAPGGTGGTAGNDGGTGVDGTIYGGGGGGSGAYIPGDAPSPFVTGIGGAPVVTGGKGGAPIVRLVFTPFKWVADTPADTCSSACGSPCPDVDNGTFENDFGLPVDGAILHLACS